MWRWQNNNLGLIKLLILNVCLGVLLQRWWVVWSQWKQDGIVLERNGIKKQFFWLTKKKLYANLALRLCWGGRQREL